MKKKEAGPVLAVGGAILIGVGILAYSKTTGDVGCTLTAAGIGVIAEGASRGRSGEALLLAAGVGAACKPLVDKIIDGSSEEVSFDLETADGKEHFEIPAFSIPEPATQPPPSTPLECALRYPDPGFAYELCKALAGG